MSAVARRRGGEVESHLLGISDREHLILFRRRTVALYQIVACGGIPNAPALAGPGQLVHLHFGRDSRIKVLRLVVTEPVEQCIMAWQGTLPVLHQYIYVVGLLWSRLVHVTAVWKWRSRRVDVCHRRRQMALQLSSCSRC